MYRTHAKQEGQVPKSKPLLAKGSAPETIIKCIKGFIDGIKKGFQPSQAAKHLGDTTKPHTMAWKDENDLDLMHHMVLLKNAEAVEYLLHHGYFQAPFEPKVNPYLHLACKLGARSVISILLQYRKDDNRPSSVFTYNPENNNLGTHVNGLRSLRREITPIDIAAEEGHLNCVKQILDQCVIKEFPEHARSPYVALACVPGSVPALRLILKKDKQKPEDLHKAIEIAVKTAKPQCLDILFGTGVKLNGLFDGLNFFHVLYTNSSIPAFGSDGYRRIPEVTSVLTKHRHKVNCKGRPNSYPLYSLIRNALCIHDYVNTRHYLACLRLLLEAGADPNFDEVAHEAAQNKKGIKTVIGRPAFSSAMHCLLDTAELYAESLDSKALCVKFIVQFAELLVQHNARINSVGRLCEKTHNHLGSVLHQFAKSSVKLGVDKEVFRFLLRQGADPNSRVNGKYVVNTFFDTLFARLCDMKSWERQPDMTEDVKQMLELTLYMTRPSVEGALRILKHDYGKNTKEQIKAYLKTALVELEKRAKEVWPLKRICRTMIWDICARDASRVHQLPTDVESRTFILPIF